MARPIPCALILAFVLAIGSAPETNAQGTARSLDFDTSIRAAGMGGAGVGVAWGHASLWGNPAALALRRGIQWEHSHTQLVPDLADDVYLDSDQLVLGLPGVAVSRLGPPVGGVKLTYGFSEGTDQYGNPTGLEESHEAVEGAGVAFSLLGLVDGVRRFGGSDSHLEAFGDLSFGFQRRRATLSFSGLPESHTDPDAADWGILVRLTPVHPGFPEHNRHLFFDLGFGMSVLGANDAEVDFGLPEPSPATRIRRKGGAVRFGIQGEPIGHPHNPAGRLVTQGMLPLLAVSLASDESRISAGDFDGYSSHVSCYGLELGVANVAFVRFGHVSDRTGGIVDDTFGWGLQLPLGDVAGVRFDHASFPEAAGLRDVQRSGWSVWFDPIALMRGQRPHSITS